jgi:RNA polymerase sigma-70 factor (ECF subfamily)
MTLLNPGLWGQPDVEAHTASVTDIARAPGKAVTDSKAVVSDKTLMGRIAAGDQASFEVLYRRYAAVCLGLSRRIVVDRHLAEDAVQAAFLAVWEHADRFRPERGSLCSWLLNITHHKAVDVIRVQQAQRSRSAPEDWLSQAIDAGLMPQEQGEIMLESRRAVAAISQLSRPHREVLMLCYYGGYTQSEVAARLGLPLGTVKSRCRDALQRLRKSLATSPPDETAEHASQTY